LRMHMCWIRVNKSILFKVMGQYRANKLV
jgi:hypothetical protein